MCACAANLSLRTVHHSKSSLLARYERAVRLALQESLLEGNTQVEKSIVQFVPNEFRLRVLLSSSFLPELPLFKKSATVASARVGCVVKRLLQTKRETQQKREKRSGCGVSLGVSDCLLTAATGEEASFHHSPQPAEQAE